MAFTGTVTKRRLPNGRSARRARLPKPVAPETRLDLFFPVANSWSSRENATNYLCSDFRDLLFGVAELLLAGEAGRGAAYVLFDLANVAEALGDTLRAGARCRVDYQAAPRDTASLASEVAALCARLNPDGITYDTEDGTHEVLGSSLEALHQVIGCSALRSGTNHRQRWEREMKARRTAAHASLGGA